MGDADEVPQKLSRHPGFLSELIDPAEDVTIALAASNGNIVLVFNIYNDVLALYVNAFVQLIDFLHCFFKSLPIAGFHRYFPHVLTYGLVGAIFGDPPQPIVRLSPIHHEL